MQFLIGLFLPLIFVVSRVHHQEFPSILDTLIVDNPVITNCLIDMRGIECILVIKVSRLILSVSQSMVRFSVIKKNLLYKYNLIIIIIINTVYSIRI